MARASHPSSTFSDRLSRMAACASLSPRSVSVWVDAIRRIACALVSAEMMSRVTCRSRLRSIWARAAASASALISVSLSAATDDGREAAQKYVERFLWITKFEPVRTLLLAGALRYSEYEYFKVEIVKHIVSKTAGDFDKFGDHEFTDWNALAQFLDAFLGEVSGARARGAK